MAKAAIVNGVFSKGTATGTMIFKEVFHRKMRNSNEELR
jgi:hypothetical protein